MVIGPQQMERSFQIARARYQGMRQGQFAARNETRPFADFAESPSKNFPPRTLPLIGFIIIPRGPPMELPRNVFTVHWPLFA